MQASAGPAPGVAFAITAPDGVSYVATVLGRDDDGAVVARSRLPFPAGVERVVIEVDGPTGRRFACEADAAPGEREQTVRLTRFGAWQLAEQRRSERWPAPARRVRCRVDGWTFDAYPVDVSATGCRLTGGIEPLVAGSALEVASEADGGAAPIWITATVVWVRRLAFGKLEAGLRFVPETERERARIREWRDRAAAAHRRPR